MVDIPAWTGDPNQSIWDASTVPVMASRVVRVHDDQRYPDRLWATLDTGLMLALTPDDLFPMRYPSKVTVSIIMAAKAIGPIRAIGVYLGLHQ